MYIFDPDKYEQTSNVTVFDQGTPIQDQHGRKHINRFFLLCTSQNT